MSRIARLLLPFALLPACAFDADAPSPEMAMDEDEVLYHEDSKADGVTLPPALWRNGVVPIAFADDVAATERALVWRACAVWEGVADVRCLQRTDERAFIVVRQSTRNSSYVGAGGGMQTIDIVSWDLAVLVHELGHALGRIHEQSRPDRDQFVVIEWENVKEGHEHNFDRRDRVPTFHPYDFDSTMHYGQWAFSANGKATLAPQERYAEYAIYMGQRTHLSYGDRIEMAGRYGWPWLVPGESRWMADIDDGYLRYRIDVPARTPRVARLVVESAGDGNADLYLKRGECPKSEEDHIEKSAQDGSAEKLEVTDPAPGAWCVLVHAKAAYGSVELFATLE